METLNQSGERAVYYLSTRPEAYELWGEISHEDAEKIGRLIAERAAARFPEIDFRIDGEWHVQQVGMDQVSAFIDDHLAAWVDEATQVAAP